MCRPLWRHYFQNTQGLIFVVDSNDRERIQEAQDELQKMVSNYKMLEVRVADPDPDLFGRIRIRKFSPYPDPIGTLAM